jgi:hypothetical protein
MTVKTIQVTLPQHARQKLKILVQYDQPTNKKFILKQTAAFNLTYARLQVLSPRSALYAHQELCADMCMYKELCADNTCTNAFGWF